MFRFSSNRSRYVTAAFALFLAIPAFRPASQAAVVVLVNDAARELHFTLLYADGKQERRAIERDEVLPIPVVERIGVAFDGGDSEKKYALDPNTIHHFSAWSDKVDLGTFVLPTPPGEEGKPPPKPRLIPRSTITFKVKILADDNQPAKEKVWEKIYGDRVEAVSDVFEKFCGVRFKVVAFDRWVTSNSVTEFNDALHEFETKVNPAPAQLAIGFTSQFDRPQGTFHLGGTRGPLYPFVFIRDWPNVVSKTERVETIMHELGHYLAAAHSGDPLSNLRPQIGDRRSNAVAFRLQFDALNTLAMNIFTDELRSGEYRGWMVMPIDAKRQLQRIYLALHAELPRDPAAPMLEEMLQLPKPIPKATPKDVAANPVEGVKNVVKEVTQSAKVNASGVAGLKGDQLTEYLVRNAALEAQKLPPPIAAKAFLIGVALSLDNTLRTRKFPQLRDFAAKVETDADSQERVRYLGQPTMRGRNDAMLHFFISAAIAAFDGPAAADAAGMAKEISDSYGKSGFSYADICADRAGVAFAEGLLKNEFSLADLKEKFSVNDFMPSQEGLPEGFSAQQFAEQTKTPEGGESEYSKQLKEIQSRLDALAVKRRAQKK